MRVLVAYLMSVPLAAQIAAVDAPTGCLLGGWQRGRWTDGKALTAALKSARTYRVIGTAGNPGPDRQGSAPKPLEGPCGEAMEVKFEPALPEGSVAVTGSAKEHSAESIPKNSRSYLSLFRKTLDEKGVKSPVKVDQLLRIDLDGDGKMEVLASLYSVQKEGVVSSTGDYSLLLMRRVDAKEQVSTQIIGFEKDPREGGMTHRTFGPFIDLNGDGKAEVIVRGEYAQGQYTHVYELQNGKLVRVLECNCGG